MVQPVVPKPAPGTQNYNTIAAQYARAKAIKDAEDRAKALSGANPAGGGVTQEKSTVDRLNDVKKHRFLKEWLWVLGAFVWFL